MILIVDMTPNKLGRMEYVEPIVKIVGSECDVKRPDEIVNPNQYDKIIISGTFLKDNSHLHVRRLEFLREFNKPVLGICAGMQIIGLLFGAKIDRVQEIGMVKIKTKIDNPLIKGEFEVYCCHNCAVDMSGVEELEILAESSNCVEMIGHKYEKIYGVQFHPEVRNANIIENFLRL